MAPAEIEAALRMLLAKAGEARAERLPALVELVAGYLRTAEEVGAKVRVGVDRIGGAARAVLRAAVAQIAPGVPALEADELRVVESEAAPEFALPAALERVFSGPARGEGFVWTVEAGLPAWQEAASFGFGWSPVALTRERLVRLNRLGVGPRPEEWPLRALRASEALELSRAAEDAARTPSDRGWAALLRPVTVHTLVELRAGDARARLLFRNAPAHQFAPHPLRSSRSAEALIGESAAADLELGAVAPLRCLGTRLGLEAVPVRVRPRARFEWLEAPFAPGAVSLRSSEGLGSLWKFTPTLDAAGRLAVELERHR